MDNISKEIATFLNIFISEEKEFFLTHYSCRKSPINLAEYDALGKDFFTLVACHFSVSIEHSDEKNLDRNKRLIKAHLIQNYSDKLLKSPLFHKFHFGDGVTDSEKYSNSVLNTLLFILVGQVVAIGYFKNLYTELTSKKFSITETDKGLDYKTLLQEELQKKKQSLPVYETLDITGPQHDLTFKVSAKVDSIKVIATEQSKKKAQRAAAKLLLQKINPKLLVSHNIQIKLNQCSLTFYKQGLRNPNFTFPFDLYRTFNLPTDINLMPAIIHSRFKGMGYWGQNSQRQLAMLGADLLDVLLGIQIANISKVENNYGNNKFDLAQAILANERLVKIYDSGFINIGALPFKHSDLQSLSYKVDCIQSLFSISFLNSLENDDLKSILDSQALNWIYKKAIFLFSKEKSDLKSLSNIVLERIQALGLLFSFEKNGVNISIRLTGIKSGNTFLFAPDNSLDSNKDIKQYLSSLLLKILDATEGIGLSPNFQRNKFKAYIDLIKFVDAELISNRKVLANDNAIKVDLLEPKNFNKFCTFSYHELLTELANQDLGMQEKVEILIRVRIYLGLNNSLNEAKYFQYLPIVFDNYYSDIASNSIINFSDEEANNKNDELIIEGNTLITHKTSDTDSLGAIKPKIADSSYSVKKAKQRVTPKTKATSTLNIKNSDQENHDYLASFENKISTLKISEIESLWKNKEMLLDSVEEAAIVLSFLRYERGIDFQRLKYIKFVNSELLDKTTLSSMFSTKNTEQKAKIEKNKVVKIKKVTTDKPCSDFKVEKNDAREFTERKVAVRGGQSKFRRNVMSIWENCCISGCKITSIVEAAHIAPYRGEKDNHIQNGLILRVDLHRLFDSYLIGINPDTMKIELAPELTESEYREFKGTVIEIPTDHRVSKKALIYRWHTFCQNNEIQFLKGS